ncbi:MAG: type II toxin-antitoxin system PemK/MazF family toxin [Acidimicrobiaceae bacterium]|nr:type II toxin-antitoxin system PemK/MazF family toxin [Acidimicrobiaceae bacterium]MYK74975.1 type II toxin-antitoxin system PemK/MazF family toxin [Acidimicrobiaceae bacterium]
MNVQRVHRGELWWWESPYAGRRPVVVLSRDAALARLNTAIVAPCTTNVRGLVSEVVLEPGDDPVSVLSAVNLDSVESVAQALLTERMGRLSDHRMRQVCTALSAVVACG